MITQIKNKITQINFVKMEASGNDFIVVSLPGRQNLKDLARRICNRKYGVGADGLILLNSGLAKLSMRIFNPDGSEPEMCGNGARCVALWISAKRNPSTTLRIDGERSPELVEGQGRTIKAQSARLRIKTKAGIVEADVKNDKVKIKMTKPKDIRLDFPIKISKPRKEIDSFVRGKRTLRVNFINTGVPHAVILVEGLDKIDVINIGRYIRFHKRFAPSGTNVDFVEFMDDNNIKIRTYERGVEDETLACGTGAVAAALIVYRLLLIDRSSVNIHTRSGELLRVYFEARNGSFDDVWLEGRARLICKGVYYV